MRNLRHKIAVTCYTAIDSGKIASHLLEDVEKLYIDYESLNGNTYVHNLMERIRKLPIKHYDE